MILYVIEKLILVNNARLKDTTGEKEISLDFIGSNFIGLMGQNGSGKSTIIEEITPLPIYGRYVIGEVGSKTVVMNNGE